MLHKSHLQQAPGGPTEATLLENGYDPPVYGRIPQMCRPRPPIKRSLTSLLPRQLVCAEIQASARVSGEYSARDAATAGRPVEGAKHRSFGNGEWQRVGNDSIRAGPATRIKPVRRNEACLQQCTQVRARPSGEATAHQNPSWVTVSRTARSARSARFGAQARHGFHPREVVTRGPSHLRRTRSCGAEPPGPGTIPWDHSCGPGCPVGVEGVPFRLCRSSRGGLHMHLTVHAFLEVAGNVAPHVEFAGCFRREY